MELTREEEKIIKTCGISREAFIAERQREEQEAQRRQSGTTQADADEQVLRRSPGVTREAFFETRRLEEAEKRRMQGGGGTTLSAARGDKSREKFLVTADAGEVNRLVAARDAQRIARTA